MAVIHYHKVRGANCPLAGALLEHMMHEKQPLNGNQPHPLLYSIQQPPPRLLAHHLPAHQPAEAAVAHAGLQAPASATSAQPSRAQQRGQQAAPAPC
jgi:hypothetical protein